METNRRGFIENGLKIAVIGGIAGIAILPGCKAKNRYNNEGQDVSPTEDLMQEHGLLNRLLLIYDTCKAHIRDNEGFPIESLAEGAGIVRTFVEDYHEKQEEKYLFPRFQKANQLTDLVQVLLQQHKAGRIITDQVIQLCKGSSRTETENQRLGRLLTDFNWMYRPHEAREDTVLFPAFRNLVSNNEYDSLGEEFEKNEHKLFGNDGFESMVDKVAGIEKSLGIYDLADFTPQI